MKKAISITLSSSVFQIEEDAYNKLDQYLDSIKDHYGSGKESEEILADIESSIAEKFLDKTKKKASINMKDVEEVIMVMGTISEIREQDEIQADQKVSEDKEEKDDGDTAIKKLYRNPDDQIIAGVCSGLGAYFGIDPVIIRLVFIALIFAGGSGVIAYIILWAIMPLAKTGTQKLEMRGKPVNLKEIEETIKEKSKEIKKEGKQAIEKIKKKWHFV